MSSAPCLKLDSNVFRPDYGLLAAFSLRRLCFRGIPGVKGFKRAENKGLLTSPVLISDLAFKIIFEVFGAIFNYSLTLLVALPFKTDSESLLFVF